MSVRHHQFKKSPLFFGTHLREIGEKNQVGDANRTLFSLYSRFKPLITWDPQKTVDSCHHGGIFNFDFSPDGSMLAAACEGHSVLMFDPFTQKVITEVNKAHNDCVNCVRFLDSRLFATCSDDKNVALWDIRYLKTPLHILSGHTNWVKNIEYAADCGKLVTSGFDGNIFTWDINSYCNGAIQGEKVFTHKMLMRSKLSPDCTKLIVSTQEGKLIMINNLDLSYLAHDLKEFQLNCNRFNQRDGTSTNRNKRNNFEIINDWPLGNAAGDIASIQIHPQGWCALSRNVSRDYKSEWTCVHDIQDFPETDDDHTSERGESVASDRDEILSSLRDESNASHINLSDMDTNSTDYRQPYEVPFVMLTSELDSPLSPESEASTDAAFGVVERQTLANGFAPPRISLNGNDLDTTEESSTDDELERAGLPFSSDRSNAMINLMNIFDYDNEDTPFNFYRRLTDYRFMGRNKPRLLHFIEEPNVGRGFIKELCFSGDGRLVCSPFGFGVRLLSFDPECSELCDITPANPIRPLMMYEVENCVSHSNVVVTCKFSPRHCLFVSGCLSGKVAFHQPVL